MQHAPLKDIAALFLRMGFTAFGGPAVHTAIMKQEVVEKRKWIDEQHFLDLVGATNLIPGPNSTELAIHIGHIKGGWRGLLVAGLCFILPAVFITGVLAYFYKQYGQLPQVQPFIYGIKPAIIAIIPAAIYPLAKKSLKSTYLAVTGVIVLALSLLHFNEVYLLFGAGIIALLYHLAKQNKTTNSILPIAMFNIPAITLGGNLQLFLIFLKIGAVLYGTGYVLFAFLDTELVTRGLLTRQQLMDAIAVGQFTPGPIFSSVTFVGYQINGWQGAVAATVGVFLPAFVFVALLKPVVKALRNSVLFSSFLDAVNVASIAIIISVCVTMARETITDWRTITIAVVSLAIAFGYRQINSAWLVVGGAVAGYLLSLV
ncbi:MAG TPA: chromate efflux transporter [Chitinophagales bacterium]|nr:chromate efflux transporter [Chitinophagales bacterium]